LIGRKHVCFAVGHLALGYLLGKGSSRPLKTNPNVPLVLALSIIPDIDLVFRVVQHRGPTHSLILILAVFVPFFVVYRRKAVPYALALISHPLIGDYIIGSRVQLFWPLPMQFGTGTDIGSQLDVALEWALFLVAMIIMLKAKDMARLFQPRDSNLISTIPAFTTLLPILVSFPLGVPLWLMPPHVIFILVFAASIVIVLSKKVKDSTRSFLRRPPQKPARTETLATAKLMSE
jgi:membrane-bound metal-dependent hydrolase YbcI (DUF457 family)